MKNVKSFLRNYLRKLKLYFDADAGIMMFLMALAAVTPVISVACVNTGADLLDILSVHLPDGGYSPIYKKMFVLALLTLLAFFVNYINSICVTKMSQKLELTLNRRLMLAYSASDYLETISEQGTSRFSLAKSQTDVNAITVDIYMITGILNGISQVISYSILLYTKLNFWVVLLCLVLFMISVWINLKNAKAQNVYRVDNVRNERKADYLASLITNLSAAKEVLTYHLSDYLLKKWREKYTENKVLKKEVEDRKFRRNQLSVFATQFIVFAVLLLLFLFRRITTIGEFTLFSAAILSLQSALQSVAENISMVYQTGMQFAWYEEYIAEKDHLPSAASSEEPDKTDSIIRLKDVSFQFPNQDRKVLDNISLDIEKGKVIAIVGENGAGKTTLINLILGLYQPTGGNITCMNKDPYTSFKHGESSDIAYISQNFSTIPAMTVRNNILLERELDENILPADYDKYLREVSSDTVVGESFGGRNFSKGQEQKIAFLRVKAFDRPILILDEPTAALDPIAEMTLFNDYIRDNKDKSILLITHRLGSVRNADRILCLRNGKIAEDGSHEELMAKKGFYYEMFESQAKWYRSEKT